MCMRNKRSFYLLTIKFLNIRDYIRAFNCLLRYFGYFDQHAYIILIVEYALNRP